MVTVLFAGELKRHLQLKDKQNSLIFLYYISER